MDDYSFSGRLRELMETRGVIQKWLADAAETTEATISRYVAGKTQPDLAIVVRIAKALNVSVDYLCGATNLTKPLDTLSREYVALLKYYERADNRDRAIIWTALSGYMEDDEKHVLSEFDFMNIT